MERIGLVLEGGGMRGVYSAGILEFFLEKALVFPYVIGVSAGACNACSYISGQRGRNKTVNLDYIRDSRYLSFRNLIRSKALFGMDFIFDEIPNRLVPFDYDRFYESDQQFVVGATDCRSGKAVYFRKSRDIDMMRAIRASSSLPLLAPIVWMDGRPLLDGGLSDSIPVRKSMEDGNRRNVVILTRPEGYRKKRGKMLWLIRKKYAQYPELLRTISERHRMYNDVLDEIDRLEQRGDVFAMRPAGDVQVGRTERNPRKLLSLFERGYQDAEQAYPRLLKWLETQA